MHKQTKHHLDRRNIPLGWLTSTANHFSSQLQFAGVFVSPTYLWDD